MNNPVLHRFNALLGAALILFYLTWWIAAGKPQDALSITVLVVAILPLVPLLPGVWRGRRFETALAGLLVPFHFAYAAMELIANPEVRTWVALQSFITLLLFIALMAALRQVRQPSS